MTRQEALTVLFDLLQYYLETPEIVEAFDIATTDIVNANARDKKEAQS